MAEKQDLKSAVEVLGGDRERLIGSVKKRTAEVVECIETLEGELIKEIDTFFKESKSDLQKKEAVTDQPIASLKGHIQYDKEVLNHGLLPDITQADAFLQCSEDELSQSLDRQSVDNACTVQIFNPSNFKLQIDNIGKMDHVTINLKFQNSFRFQCDFPINHTISEISPSTNGEKAWILFSAFACYTYIRSIPPKNRWSIF
jgi:hypothetical protein